MAGNKSEQPRIQDAEARSNNHEPLLTPTSPETSGSKQLIGHFTETETEIVTTSKSVEMISERKMFDVKDYAKNIKIVTFTVG